MRVRHSTLGITNVCAELIYPLHQKPKTLYKYTNIADTKYLPKYYLNMFQYTGRDHNPNFLWHSASLTFPEITPMNTSTKTYQNQKKLNETLTPGIFLLLMY